MNKNLELKLFKEEDYTKVNFCIDLYKPCITDAVLNHFKKLFPHEFKEFSNTTIE
jgi:hypothetical protein